MKKFVLLVLIYIISFSGSIYSQTPPSWTSADMYLAIRKLNVLGSVLYLAAHPDDENTRLIAYLSKDRMLRTGYLSITRGDGGQNLIGDEQGIELGLIRTQELLSARRIDGGEQFFTRAYDFGYSKTPEETFDKWNKEKILSDVVWIIRMFQPDVIVTRFPTTGEGGHGHHTASAILGNEAFEAAANPNRFPEQLKYVKPWQVKRIMWNTFNFGGNNTTREDQLKIDVGGYNPLLGKSYGEIAAESRSQHKSQGFGVPASRGEQLEYFSSTNGSAGWSTGYVDYRANNSTRADICGFRSAPGFYSCASSENTVSFVPAVYYSATNNVWGNIISQVNHINTNPFTAQPRAGVRYGPEGESCFTLWTEYSGSTNVWASVGCSGNVKAYRHLFFRGVVEGLWDAPADTMKSDTMKIYLRKDFSPYEITDSAKAFLTNDGYGDFWFTNALNLTSYYVVAKHRNSLETWSSDKITFSPVFAEYNFANDPSMTYGNNVTQVDTDPLYAFYSGDVNDDDAIDLSDVIIINNDAGIFTSGYIISDLNGDNTTDLSDVLLAKNNASGFVALIRP